MQSQQVIITGGTGMVGTALTHFLVKAGYEVIILTRNPGKAVPDASWAGKVRYAKWDVQTQNLDATVFASASVLIHLAGAGVVDRPWTTAYKKEILESRVNSSKLLIKAIEEHGSKLNTVVSASAIGWYGADKPGNNQPFTEEAPHAHDFLGETCYQWEESIKPVSVLGKRLVILRFGIVLGNSGGALTEFKKPLRFRVAGILGNGKQVVSWIHLQDLCNMVGFCIENKAIQGVYNAVAPFPVTNRGLTLSLARSMFGNYFLTARVPTFVIRLILGARSIEVLKSSTVSASKILAAGYKFSYPEIEEAMMELNNKKNEN